MDKDIVRKLKNAADRWEKENPIICVGNLRICDALRDAAYAIEGLNDRLAAYEETGLEPEDVPTGLELAEYTSAIRLLKQYEALGTIDNLTALAKARDDGRVVVLPCKVGTPIWYIDVSIEPSERGSSKWTTRKRVKATKFDYSVLDWIDTPIYLSRAEAEAALKGAVDHEAD